MLILFNSHVAELFDVGTLYSIHIIIFMLVTFLFLLFFDLLRVNLRHLFAFA